MQFLVFGIIAVCAVAADMVVKYLAVNFLQPLGSVSLIDGVFSLTYLENRGAAFGILQNKQYFFIAFTAVVLILIIVYLAVKRPKSIFMWVSLALVCGGALGNLIDRVRLGYVVDLFYFEPINFPVFNVADICVCVGAALAVILILLDKENGNKKDKV